MTAVDLAMPPAVILAGGRGTRLLSRVADRPKALAPIAGRPFLWYVFRRLARWGITEAVLCTGYLGDQIESEFGECTQGIKLSYSHEDTALGTGGALRLARERIGKRDALVLNGDSWSEVDLAAFVRAHRAVMPMISMVLARPPRDSDRFGSVHLDPSGHVVGFTEKNGEPTGWINAGIYLVTPELINSIDPGKCLSLEFDVFPKWVGEGFCGFAAGEVPFIDIGLPETYEAAEAFFALEVPRLTTLDHVPAQTFTKSGAAAIVRDAHGRILLERRVDCGLWSLPGGRVSPGESVAAAVQREVREETGLDIRIERLLGVYSRPEGRVVRYPDNGDVAHLLDTIVVAEAIGGTLFCSSESESVRFFEASALPEDIMPAALQPLRDFVSGRTGVLD